MKIPFCSEKTVGCDSLLFVLIGILTSASMLGAQCPDMVFKTGSPASYSQVQNSGGVLPTGDTWREVGDQRGCLLGYSVSSAGDVNGDGKDDVIVGVPYFDGGELNEGRIEVHSTTGYPREVWTVEANQEDANLGISVSAAGDVNGDGYDDVIAGAPGFNENGAVYICYGSSDGLNTETVCFIEGGDGYHNFGVSVSSAGDVNGDGFDDIIIGADEYSNSEVNEGGAIVYYGSATGIDTASFWIVESNRENTHFGHSVSSAGDVNGDGYDDIIIGAKGYQQVQENEGAAYVYHGSPSGLDTTANWFMEGNQIDAEFGFSVSTAGDVNGDGYDDVIIGAIGYTNGEEGEGAAFVYHGSDSGLGEIANWMMEGNQAGAKFGYSVSTAGDVNSDQFSDVIIGAPYYDNGNTDEGKAFVYHGFLWGLDHTAIWTEEIDRDGVLLGFSVSNAGDMNGDGYDDLLIGVPYIHYSIEGQGAAFAYHSRQSSMTYPYPDWVAEEDGMVSYLGGSVSSAGDVNGDGFEDVIVGARGYSGDITNEGAAYVYHGSESGLAEIADWMVQGGQEDSKFGLSVALAGDVNGDGYDDVLVGSTRFDNVGAVFGYYGSPTGLNQQADWVVKADQGFTGFGTQLASAGDVNGDGYDDVMIGVSGHNDKGAVFVYYGSDTGLGTIASWSMEGSHDGSRFGNSVSCAGDVNNDGYDDIIVGAIQYSNGENIEGAAFVYHGSSSGLSSSANWIIEGDQEACMLGSAVSSAGDVNGDGYDDVIIGGVGYTNGEESEGVVYLYQGSSSGLGATAAWTVEGNRENAGIGGAISTAGDMNNDGFSDVMISDYNRQEYTSEGFVHVYYGSESGLETRPRMNVSGRQPGAQFGYSLASAGDVNGDGFDDVMIGSSWYTNGQAREGLAFVFYGSLTVISPPADLLLSEVGDPNSAWGEYSAFGGNVETAGDVNGDGYGDLIVSAWDYTNGESREGAAFVYYGSELGLSDVAGWSIEGNQSNAMLGMAVSTAGDVNGDGFDDVLISSSGDNYSGRVSLYQGSSTGLSNSPVWEKEGTPNYGSFGRSISTLGDVNGDGYDDICIGDSSYTNGEPAEGMVVVYYGSATGLSDVPDWSAEGNQRAAGFGCTVTSAGDVNNDGYNDLLVVAWGYKDNEKPGEGAVFVYHGSSSGLSQTPDCFIDNNMLSGLYTGKASSAGDVNDDGFDDVILCGYDFIKSRSYVFYGSATGLETSPFWKLSMDISQIGWFTNCSNVGDLNGDGYDDVVVGSSNYGSTPSQLNEGTILLFHGSSSGLSQIPNWQAESNQKGAYLGDRLAYCGDVNGDGLDELAFGATGYGHNGVRSGTAFVYYGKEQLFLSYTVNGKGSVSGEVTQTLEANEDGTSVEAIPASGYKFIGWSDGSTDNPRIDTNVTENVFVSAIFVQDEATGWMLY